MRRRLPVAVPGDVAAAQHKVLGGPGAGLRGVRGNSVAMRQIFPPWLYPMEQGNDFNIVTIGGAKVAVLAAAVGATLTSDPLRLTDSDEGVVRLMTIFVDAPTTAIDVNWTLRINGAPVPGWTVTTFPRNANNLSIDTEGVVRLPAGALVDVLIENRAATGPWTVGVQIGGWYYSQRAAQDFYGDL